ncbi:LPS-assembly protein LptD [Pseudonocardia sp. TMWB2A]
MHKGASFANAFNCSEPVLRPIVALAFSGLSLFALATTDAYAQDLAQQGAPVPAPSSVQVPDISEAPPPVAPLPGERTPPIAPPESDAPAITNVNAADQVVFSADRAGYDNKGDLLTAEGNVYVEHDGQRLRANKVEWNRKTDEVIASGNVAATNPAGDVAYSERVTLTGSLREGVAENLLVVMENGARFAANRGQMLANGDLVLDYAAYTPCAVETEDGCPKEPSWQVKAVKVTYDKAKDRVRYKGARAELFGLPLIPLPGLTHGLRNEPKSGLLVPSLRLDRVNGVEVQVPYYFRLAPNRDITVTPHFYTESLPMLEAEYRELNSLGAFRVTGYATYSNKVDVSGEPVDDGHKALRAYVDATGKFQISPTWSVSASIRRATDRTFLRRYDISRDDRLRSNVAIERIGGSSYFSIGGWAVQTLRVGDKQGLQPVALPMIDFRQRWIEPVFAGKVELQLNSLALSRSAGQDTQRAFAGVRWDLRRLTPWGQEVDFTLYARGDVYHSDENLLTAVPSYRGESGWQARAIAAAAIDVRWPLVGEAFGGTQRLTPRVQLVAAPPVKNLDIPNEDSRAFDLEDSNLFALNRFPGYDRFEDSARVTYGVEWALDRPGLAINAVVGQSYRLDNKLKLFPEGTGHTDRTSDIIGRTTVAYKDFVRFTHRYRVDKDNLAVRRNEIDARVGSRSTYGEIGYLRLNRDIDSYAEDLRDREELRVGGRVQFAEYWSIFGSAIVDLSDKTDDPTFTTDGFTPLRHRLGIAYEDDCITFGVTWRRDYEEAGDARRGNSFLLRLAIRNLGV